MVVNWKTETEDAMLLFELEVSNSKVDWDLVFFYGKGNKRNYNAPLYSSSASPGLVM